MAEAKRSAIEGLEDLFAVLDRVPFVAGVKRDAGKLRRMLYERRPPRVMVVGEAGSGRSTLLNLLMERDVLPTGDEERPVADGSWVGVDAKGSRVSWLEVTPSAEHALLREALAAGGPDLVLAVLPVDTEAQRATLKLARDLAKDEGGVPVLAVVTRVDTCAPRELRAKSRAVEEELGALGLTHRRVFGVGAPHATGVAVLADALIEALPDAAKVEAARSMPPAHSSRLAVAREIVRASGSLSVTVALVPLPLSDLVVLGPLQAAMVSSIVHLAGREYDRETLGEWVASLGVVGGAGFGLRWGAQQLVKLVPGAGSIFSAGIAGAGTAALGKSAIAWFLERGR